MRILFISQPMYGHVNTVLPQAIAAQDAGHEVIFATGAGLTPHVESHGLETWQVGPDAAPRGNEVDWIGFFVSSAASRAETLMTLARRWRPDLVIHEETELAGGVVASGVDATEVVHGLGLMPPLRLFEPLGPAVEQLARSLDVSIESERLRAAPYLDVCPSRLYTPEERMWPDVRPVRHHPGSPLPGEQLPPELDHMPHERFAHLTLGTVFNNKDVLSIALAGLRGLPINIVVTTGPGIDPAVLGPQPDNVLVLPYVSHVLLLSRCDLVVSHVGAGVMLGALAEGAPQLALPQGVDQHMNAEALVASGAGLMLDGAEVTVGAVEEAAHRLLAESGFAASAGGIRSEMRSMPSPADAIAELSATLA